MRRCRNAAASRGRQAGFSLIEVLVSVVVMTIGLTGMAALQLTSLKSAHSTYQRTRASILVYEMGDRLRANRAGALNGDYDAATLCDVNARHADDARACAYDAADDFAGTGMATEDLSQWWSNLGAAELHNWYAAIQRDPANGNFIIAVQWDDTRAKPGQATTSATKVSCLGTEMPIQLEEVCIRTQL